jgi:acylphosphatase
MKRTIITFTGRVQGVGFRYTAQKKALELKLSGSIQNQLDGSVKAIVEGDDSAIFSLIHSLSSFFSITEIQISFDSSLKGLEDFLITYS